MKSLSRFPLAAAVIAISLATLPAFARADVLAEFLFWNEMGKAAGQAARSVEEYRSIRQDLKNRIAAAETEVARCGGCASAQADLRRWQAEENRLEEGVGAVLQSTGTPPVIADFLGVALPVSRGRSLEEQRAECAITRPAWYPSLPASCQQAVDAHVACRQAYENRHGLCSARVASEPGAACWDTSKLFRHCAAGDFATFERERQAQRMRRDHPTMPEYVDHGSDKFLLYPHAPAGFVPELPPPAVIDEVLADPQLFRLDAVIGGAANGNLRRVRFERFHWGRVVPHSECLTGRARDDDELSRRICDDLYDLNYHHRPALLACAYAGPANREAPEAFYWYAAVPDAARPALLLERASGHPVLRIGDARTDCPATLDAVEATRRERSVQLASLGVQQIPASVALPRSALWQRDLAESQDRYRAALKKRLAAFAFEGYFSVSSAREVGTRNARMKYGDGGHCVIEATGDASYELACGDRRRSYSGLARLTEDGLAIDWSDGSSAVYTPTENGKALHATLRGASHFLRRVGPDTPDQFARRVAALVLDGRYALALNRGDHRLELTCEVARDSRTVPHSFGFTCYTDDGDRYVGQGQPQIQEPMALRLTHWSPKAPSLGGARIAPLEFPLADLAPGVPAEGWAGSAEQGLGARLVPLDPAASLAFGTPIEALAGMRPGSAATARAQGIRTVEQLAAIDEAEARRMGMGWLQLRDDARASMGAADGGTEPTAAVPRESPRGTREGRSSTPGRPAPAADPMDDERLVRLVERIARMNDAQRQRFTDQLAAKAARGDDQAGRLLDLLGE